MAQMDEIPSAAGVRNKIKKASLFFLFFSNVPEGCFGIARAISFKNGLARTKTSPATPTNITVAFNAVLPPSTCDLVQNLIVERISRPSTKIRNAANVTIGAVRDIGSFSFFKKIK